MLWRAFFGGDVQQVGEGAAEVVGLWLEVLSLKRKEAE